MSEPQYDSNNEPVNEAAREEAAAQLAAARREADRPEPDAPPPGSWRAELADFEAETATIFWDGEQWDVPAEMPLAYFDAQLAGDVGAMIQAIVGLDGMRRLRIPRDFPADRLADLVKELSELAGRVWGTGNRNRSARRSQSTTRR